MANKDIKVEWKDPKSLQPHPKNRNKHPKEQIERLVDLLKYQGWRLPIIVSKLSGYIVAGHGRLEAAMLAGFEKVPVAVQDFDDYEQEYAFMVSDNAISEWANLDLGGINDDLQDLGPDFDLEMLGFKDFKLEPAEKDNPNDPDALPPAPKKAKSKTGELWILSHHRLFIGDAGKEESYKKLLGEDRANLLLTDPPYNVDYEDSEGKKIQNDKMTQSDFYQFLFECFFLHHKFLQKGSSFYIFHADSEGHNFRNAVKDSGMMLKQCLIWVKDSLVLGRSDYHWKHEPILYGWTPGASHTWRSDRRQTTIWEFDRPKKAGEHPTMKPVEMLEYAIKNSSKTNDLVMDCFGGSGSTLIAAEKTGRSARIMEIDPTYADVILTRWSEYTGLDPVREDGKKWSEINGKNRKT